MIIEWLDDYFEDQLDEKNRAQFEKHLETCKDCQMLVDDFISMKEVMSEMPLMALPTDFNEELHKKLLVAAEEIKTKQKQSKNVVPFPMKMKKTFQYMGAAAAILLVVASGVQLKNNFWWNQGGGQTEYGLRDAGGPADMPPLTEGAKTAPSPNPVATYNLPGDSVTEATNQSAETPPVEVTFTDSADGAAADASGVTEQAKTTTPNEGSGAASGRMLISTGDVTLKVAKYEVFYKAIEVLVKENGGYVESSYSGKSPLYENNKLIGSQLAGNVTLRVPSTQFQRVFEKVKTLGEVEASQQNVQDVTTQITDMTARVENLKVRETRLRDLMKQAKNVTEVMSVERELSNVRIQIDQLEGNLKQQKQQVSLSTLYVNVQESPEIGGQFQKFDGNLFERAKHALIKNINTGINLVEMVLIAIVAWSPVILIIGLVVLGLTKTHYYKNWRQKK